MILGIALAYYVILILVVGFVARRKIKNVNDFTKASSGLGWLTLTFGFTLIPLGAGHTLSLWESAPMLGASVMWWGIVTGGIFLPIMMLWIGPWLRQTGLNTVPEILEKIFGKTFGRLNAAINIATWTGIGAAETVATAVAIYVLSAQAIPLFPWCILIALILIFAYVYLGGMLQLAWLNVVNGIVMIIGSYIGMFALTGWLAGNVFFQGTSGWAAVEALFNAGGTVDVPGLAGSMLRQFDLGNAGMWFMVIIPVAVLHLSAGAVGQNMCSPFFAAKSDEDCRKGVFLGAFVNGMASVPWIVMALTAMVAIPALLAGNPDADKLGPVLLALEALPQPIVALLMISLMAATLSTGGATLLANANILTNDIIKGCLKPDMTDETKMKVIKISVLICGLLFAFPALSNAVIFPVFLWCFSFGIPIFIVYFMGLKFKISRSAAWTTIVVAYIVNFWWTFLPIPAALYGTPLDLNMYPVTIVSIVLGVILPLVMPDRQPGLLVKGGKMSDLANR